MSEYDSQKWNLFRYPLIWFLIAAVFAQAVILFNSPPIHAASTPPSTVAHAPEPPRIFQGAQGPPASAPAKVELPVRQEIKQTITTAPKKAPSPPPTRVASGNVEIAIQFAMAQLGKPYRWAGAGPNFYDCSGLVMVAFSKIGIKLPHYTKTMIGYGKPVSRGAMKRGDIVFPGSGHVGIYLGNNQFIHAPQPGEVIKISTVYAFYAARELV